MLTIDQLLNSVCRNIKLIQNGLPSKDKKILLSLSRQLTQGNFLTENQAKLLVKIFNENKELIKTVEGDLEEILKNDKWSRHFRVLQRNREIYILDTNPSMIKVDFTYDKRLKEKLHELNAELYGGVSAITNTAYGVQLSEKNILLLLDKFRDDDFTIDQKITNFYQEITEICKNVKNPFDVFQLENKNLKKLIEDDIGEIAKENLLLLHDRKFRYQYKITEKITEKSLKNDLAQRESTKVYLDSNVHSLTDIVKALTELKRFPVLVVFEGHLPKENKKYLDFLATSLEEAGVAGDVGIYFRFDKEEDVNGFNATIAQLEYNKMLSSTTLVAGIANNKIPKFMVKTGWKPNTVITFTNSFRNNKSNVYCADVDLIIYWNDKPPMQGDVHAIL